MVEEEGFIQEDILKLKEAGGGLKQKLNFVSQNYKPPHWSMENAINSP